MAQPLDCGKFRQTKYATNACVGKSPMSREVAGQVAARMRRGTFDRTVTAYRCKTCGQWHVGGGNAKAGKPSPRGENEQGVNGESDTGRPASDTTGRLSVGGDDRNRTGVDGFAIRCYDGANDE